MILDKKNSLLPILESKDGIHISAYLENRGDKGYLKEQLRQCINEAQKSLSPVLTEAQIKKLLNPIMFLENDPKLLEKMTSNIGIFRTFEAFRILSLPVPTETSCHIATTFHVKPLLNWIQNDIDFLLLGIDNTSAHLYKGDQESFYKIESFPFPALVHEGHMYEGFMSHKKLKRFKKMQAETFVSMSQWINELTPATSARLYLAGKPHILDRAARQIEYKNIVKKPIAYTFSKGTLYDICAEIRNRLQIETKDFLQRALIDLKFATHMNTASTEIKKIASDVAQGNVRRLYIAEDVHVFGKFNKRTGELRVHSQDTDHEDDDLLDDLAQEVLSQGGQVVVAPKNKMPVASPIVAIGDAPAALPKPSAVAEDQGRPGMAVSM